MGRDQIDLEVAQQRAQLTQGTRSAHGAIGRTSERTDRNGTRRSASCSESEPVDPASTVTSWGAPFRAVAKSRTWTCAPPISSPRVMI
jgi:hypothetical protein